jgi:hypothetical protein
MIRRPSRPPSPHLARPRVTVSFNRRSRVIKTCTGKAAPLPWRLPTQVSTSPRNMYTYIHKQSVTFLIKYKMLPACFFFSMFPSLLSLSWRNSQN